jgi:putative flippase GtrA
MIPNPVQVTVEFWRLVRFGFIGTMAAVAYAAVTSILIEASFTNAVAAAIIGYVVAIAISYFGHLHFSFRVKPDHQTFFWRFTVAAAISFPLTVLITYVVADILGESYRLSIAAVMVMIPTINYFCNRFWVFLPGLNRSEDNARLPSGVGRRSTDPP